MRVSLSCLLLLSIIPARVLADAGGDNLKATDATTAHALEIADAAVKTSPKDNAGNIIADGADTDKFNKPEPKGNPDDKIAVEGSDDSELDVSRLATDKKKIGSSGDYDPNKLGKQGTTTGTENKVVDELADAKHKPKEENSVSSSSPQSPPSGSSTHGTALEDKAEAVTASNVKSDNKAETIPSLNGVPAEKTAFNSLVMSWSMIIFSEIGDKTFLIAALMAMKHPRLTVFTAAFSSLAFMTVLSALMGHALPTVLPERLTKFMAAVLFVVFGVKLLREGLSMSKDSGVDEEMEEVECEIEASEINMRNDLLEAGEKVDESNGGLRRILSSPKVSADGLEMGQIPMNTRGAGRAQATTSLKGAFRFLTEGLNNLASLMLSPIWVQVFAMTFFGEWGDRSQVATIAMAAGSDYWFVIIGAIVGHGACTLAAVIGGKLLATKISMRTVTICGAVSFLVFALIYFIEGFTTD